MIQSLEDAILRVRDLHKINEYNKCSECSKNECWGCGEWGPCDECSCQGNWPCPTIKALDGETE